MKTLLTKLTGILAMLALTSALALAKPGWTEDYEKALVQAKAEKKLVLLDFTGSEWCGWCIKLDKEVFSQPEFAEYGKKNLILVELDFTSNGEPKSKEFGKLHGKILKESNIQGYPTIIVLNSEGKKVGELGYQPGGPKAFIAALEKLKGK